MSVFTKCSIAIAGAFHTTNLMLRSGLLFIERQKLISKSALLFHAIVIFDALSKVRFKELFLRKVDACYFIEVLRSLFKLMAAVYRLKMLLKC